MIDKGAASENEMILEFLSAESPRDDRVRFGRLSDERGNSERRDMLGALHGFGRNDALFEGFPDVIQWHRYELSSRELGASKYIRQRKWIDLSRGTRLVAEGAANVDRDPDVARKVGAIVRSVPTKLPRLIAVREKDGRDIVLLEGQHRATALVIAHTGIEVLVGTSADIVEWRWY